MFKDNYTKANFTDPNVKSAFDFFVNLQSGDDAPAKYGTGSQTSVSGERFSVGDLSIVWSGRWAYVAYGWDKLSFDVGIAPPPMPKANMKPYAVTSGMIAHAISANTLYKDEAYKFVEYYMTEGMKKIADAGFNIPGNKTIAKDIFKNTTNQKQKAINDYFLKIAEDYTMPVDYNPYITQARFTSILSREITLVFEKKQTLDKALQVAAANIDDAIGKAKK